MLRSVDGDGVALLKRNREGDNKMKTEVQLGDGGDIGVFWVPKLREERE